MSLATWVCFLGALQSGVLTIFMERNTHVWSVGWDSRLLAYAYSVSTNCLGSKAQHKLNFFVIQKPPLRVCLEANNHSFHILNISFFLC